MEPLWGCVALLIFLVAFVAPVVALVLALVQRTRLRRLSAEISELRGAVEVLRRHAGAPQAEQKLPVSGTEEPSGAARSAGPGSSSDSPSAPTDSREIVSAAAAAAEPFASVPGDSATEPPQGPVVGTAEGRESFPSQEASSNVGAGSGAAPPAGGREGAAPPPGLEERLGARLPVWLGGIALALAGAFLVKYSVDQGWLSPTVRVALGLVFGVALLGAGELLRGRSFRVSQALSAAGVADLYAVLLAGIRLYELIPPLVGFALMAANTAVAVLLSLRQGAIVALLGLAGGFATPALVDLGRREPYGLVFYLLLLDLGLLVVTRRRRWPGLAGAALLASLGWAGVWILDVARGGEALPVGLFLVASVALFAGIATTARGVEAWTGVAAWTGFAASRWLAALALGGGLVLLARLVDASGYGAVEWGLFGLLSAGALALALLRESELFALAPFSAAVTLALLAVRGGGVEGAAASRSYLVALAALAGVHAAGGWAASWRARSPGRWTVLSAAVLAAFPVLGYFSTRDEIVLPWAWLALAAAALSIAMLAPFARRRGELRDAETAIAAYAVVATLMVSLALPLALERSWLSVAFALEVPLLLALRDRVEIPALARLAEIAASVAAVRLLLNPEVLAYPVSPRPLLNGFLWAYGLPVLALLAAARICRRRGRAVRAELFDAGASVFLLALFTLEVWHFFGVGAPLEPFRGWGLLEWSFQAAAWAVLGLVGLEAGRVLGRRAFSIGGRIVVAMVAAQALAVHGLLANPAWSHDPVGAAPVANLLLLAYALPAAVLLVAARRVERAGGRKLPPAARACATILLFAWATLEVRHLFRGSDLAAGMASNAEQFAYSAVWALFGMALLGAGILLRSKPFRFAALAVMLLAVLKVFLFDTAELEGLYRVFSFLGLGASLLLLAHLYQRFLMRGGEG